MDGRVKKGSTNEGEERDGRCFEGKDGACLPSSLGSDKTGERGAGILT